MRLEPNGVIVLSRRNLLALLAKLDGHHHPAGSFYMIRGGSEAEGVVIRAEEDDVHYAHRPAGQMIDETEGQITRPQTGVTWY